MHLACRHRHVERIEIPPDMPRCDFHEFDASALTPIREDTQRMLIRLSRVGIANLTVKELLEREACRIASLRHQRRHRRRFPFRQSLGRHRHRQPSLFHSPPCVSSSIRWPNRESALPDSSVNDRATTCPSCPTVAGPAKQRIHSPGDSRNPRLSEFFGTPSIAPDNVFCPALSRRLWSRFRRLTSTCPRER